MLPEYMCGANVLFLTFLNPKLMPAIPPAMQHIAKTRPAGTKVIASVGGQAYSTQVDSWPWLATEEAAEKMAEEVVKWSDLYGIDGIDMDIEDGIGQRCSVGAVAFIKKLNAIAPEFIVTQPTYGQPGVPAENAVINNAYGKGNGTGKHHDGVDKTINISSVGIMAYGGTGSLGYVKNYVHATQQWGGWGYPIKQDLPTQAMIVGASGASSPGTIDALAKGVHDQDLKGIMVWYASVIDRATGKPALAYGKGAMDASAAASKEWARAIQIMNGNTTNAILV